MGGNCQRSAGNTNACACGGGGTYGDRFLGTGTRDGWTPPEEDATGSGLEDDHLGRNCDGSRAQRAREVLEGDGEIAITGEI